MQLSLLQINVMDPATLQFMIGLCGALIVILIGIIGWMINYIVNNMGKSMRALSDSIDKQNQTTQELKTVIAEITTGCKLRHDHIEKWMNSLE